MGHLEPQLKILQKPTDVHSTLYLSTEPYLRVFPTPNPQPEQTAPNANTQVNGDTKVKHTFFTGGSIILLHITGTPRMAHLDP